MRVRQYGWASALNSNHCSEKTNKQQLDYMLIFFTSRCHNRLTFNFPGSKRAEMLILFRITSLLTPHRFPLDQKEGNQCTDNHQRYHNSRNCSTSYFGAFATTTTIIGITFSRWTIVIVTMTRSSRRWWAWRWIVWRRCCCRCRTVAEGVATCPTTENLNYNTNLVTWNCGSENYLLEIAYGLQLIRNWPTELVICNISARDIDNWITNKKIFV